MTIRLSNSSFTGIARTEVAVGSSREAFMFRATAAAGPRSVTYSVTGASAGAGAGVLAAGALAAGALGAGALAGAGVAAGAGAGAAA